MLDLKFIDSIFWTWVRMKHMATVRDRIINRNLQADQGKYGARWTGGQKHEMHHYFNRLFIVSINNNKEPNV